MSRIPELGRGGVVDGDGRDDVLVVFDPVSEWRCYAGWAPCHGEVRIHSGRDGRVVKTIDRAVLSELTEENSETVALDLGPQGP